MSRAHTDCRSLPEPHSSRVGVPVATEEACPSGIGCAPFFEVVDNLQKSHDEHVSTGDKLLTEVEVDARVLLCQDCHKPYTNDSASLCVYSQ